MHDKLKITLYNHRSLTRRHEMLQKQLEKAEELVSGKAEARNALLKDVSETYIFRKRERESTLLYYILYYVLFT